MSSNQEILGREDINDLEAILSVTNTDDDAVMHAVGTSYDAAFVAAFAVLRSAECAFTGAAATGKIKNFALFWRGWN